MSEIVYLPYKVYCEDGVTRTARVKCYTFGGMAADTFFSVPAFVRAHGKTVRGFISKKEWDDPLNMPEYKFFAVLNLKNHDVIKGKTSDHWIAS